MSYFYCNDLRSILCLFLLATCLNAMDVKVFKRGKIQLVDETQFKNTLDYNFDDELRKPVDYTDVYDEIVANLPKFEVVKNGKNIGFTRLPVVTRQKPYWSTPSPRPGKYEYTTWSTPKLKPITKSTPAPSTVRLEKPSKKPTTLAVTETVTTTPTSEPTATTSSAAPATLRSEKHSKKPSAVPVTEPVTTTTSVPETIRTEKPSKKPITQQVTETTTPVSKPTSTKSPPVAATVRSEKPSKKPSTASVTEPVTTTTAVPEVTKRTRKPLFRGQTLPAQLLESTFKKVSVKTTAPPRVVESTTPLATTTARAKPAAAWTPTRQRLLRPFSTSTVAPASSSQQPMRQRFFRPFFASTQVPSSSTQQSTAFTSSFRQPSRFRNRFLPDNANNNEKATFFEKTENRFAQRYGAQPVVPPGASGTTRAPSFIVTPPNAANSNIGSLVGGNRVEQTVKSNSFKLENERRGLLTSQLRARPNAVTGAPTSAVTASNTPTETTTTGGAKVTSWSRTWSRTWSIDGNGRTSFKSSSNVNGSPPSEALRADMAKEQAASPKFRPPHKPAAIQTERHPHNGPTYNCRILDAVQDGQPSSMTDPECKLSYPGFSADGSCTCRYEVSGRDEHGCAVGFIYTCVRRVSAIPV
jgi:hypothetical protein